MESQAVKLAKYSIGIGDRFGLAGQAQLRAILKARAQGVIVTPVWNKSHREHTLVGTKPFDVRAEADTAVKALAWTEPYHVDADHVNLSNVDRFLEASDFFTLDVSGSIGQATDDRAMRGFAARCRRHVGVLELPGMNGGVTITAEQVVRAGRKYLAAAQEAGRIHRRIAVVKGEGRFITEVSMDEAVDPTSPAELFLILAALAQEGVPVQTLAPRFAGRFNKGVDYVGDVCAFTREFETDVAVLKRAVSEFGLPEDLKLSVHSGSDKFSLYAPINQVLKRHGAGVHLKTAGTTWLEELIGLAQAGGEGLSLAQEIYARAWRRAEELSAPYATVIDIDRAKLPGLDTVKAWGREEYVRALRHDPACPAFNRHFRQLLHVAYKVAAEMGETYREMVKRHAAVIARNVEENLYNRHIVPVFM